MSYSRLGWTAVIAAFAASIAAVPAAAKGGNAKAKQPTVRVTSTKAKPVKVAKAGPSATAGAKAKAPTPKVKAASAGGATKASKANGSRAVSKPTLTASDAKPTLSSKPAATTSEPKPTLSANPAPTGTLNKAQQLLLKNDNLRMKMQERLGGMDPILAAADFRNLGQFVAAVNACYNDPTIEFKALRALMTGDPPMSLGQAKQQLRATQPAVVTTTVPTTTDQR
jgi:hypothetical protein